MMSPKISIVMPAFNVEKYIGECISSVLNQSFKDFEFIIVNDGSTDNTELIINSFDDSRIKLISNKHDFIGSSNIGMSLAKGQYIARMDADDIMRENRLQLQYDFMQSNSQIDLSGGWMQAFGAYSGVIKYPVTHGEILLKMMFGSPMSHPAIFMRNQIKTVFPVVGNVRQIYDKEYIYAEDYKLWTTLAMKNFIFANIPEVLVDYRYSVNQVSYIKKEEQILCSRKIQFEYLQYIMKLILDKDSSYQSLFDDSIKRYRENMISLYELRQIAYPLFLEMYVL